MASQGLIEPEISDEARQVFDLINNGKNFLLSGGAGSGKTYSLVEVIRLVIKEKPLVKLACITYTNAAVKEIEERIDHPNLYASTIHEFLWMCISRYQNELKSIVVELINDDDYPRFKVIGLERVEENYFDNLETGIQYREFVQIRNGIISHDELLVIAEKLFEKHTKLCSIVKDSFPCIFIDEYQDTDPSVVAIFLEHFRNSRKQGVVGFFGDAMQSIYDGSIGNLDKYIDDSTGYVSEVKKEENRRNPRKIIALANVIRHDGLEQHPSNDVNAPNMGLDGNVKDGEIKFLYSESYDLKLVRGFLGWDFSDSKSTKELNLTHNLIAGKAGFKNLMRVYDGDRILEFVSRIKKFIKDSSVPINIEEKTFGQVVDELQEGKSGRELSAVSPTKRMQDYIDEYPFIYQQALKTPYENMSLLYVDKDQLLDDRKSDLEDQGKIGSQRDDLIKHLFKIQDNIRLYSEGKTNEFIRHTDFGLLSISAKRKLKENIESLKNTDNLTVIEAINMANDFGIALVDDRLLRFKESKGYIFDQVSEIPFSEFQNLYRYLEGFTPFSTQHKTKGTEFNNVLVVLDNGNWNNYNFENVFTGEGRDTVLSRTQKIFYVCCTRAKERLAVFYHKPSIEVLKKAKEWFGEENVINLGELADCDTIIYRNIDEPIRSKPSFDERWNGVDKGLITCWEVGRIKSKENPSLSERAKKGELPTLGWKGGAKPTNSYGSLNYLAQWQGLRGEDLNIDLTKEVTLTCENMKTSVTYTPDRTKYVK